MNLRTGFSRFSLQGSHEGCSYNGNVGKRPQRRSLTLLKRLRVYALKHASTRKRAGRSSLGRAHVLPRTLSRPSGCGLAGRTFLNTRLFFRMVLSCLPENHHTQSFKFSTPLSTPPGYPKTVGLTASWRAPKIAVPIRTIVAPSSMAIS